jgi:hypothetical protein
LPNKEEIKAFSSEVPKERRDFISNLIDRLNTPAFSGVGVGAGAGSSHVGVGEAAGAASGYVGGAGASQRTIVPPAPIKTPPRELWEVHNGDTPSIPRALWSLEVELPNAVKHVVPERVVPVLPKGTVEKARELGRAFLDSATESRTVGEDVARVDNHRKKAEGRGPSRL